MDPLIAPTLGAVAEHCGMGRPAERGPPPPSYQPRAYKIVHRDQMPGGWRGLHDAPDFGGERTVHPLVGIDFEDPIAATGVNAGVASRTLALPGAFDDTPGETERDFARAVAAAVEYDNDLVGEI